MIAPAEARLSLVHIVSAATFHKNATLGHKNAFSSELVYNCTPKLSTISNLNQHRTVEENVAKEWRRQLQAALHANIRVS